MFVLASDRRAESSVEWPLEASWVESSILSVYDGIYFQGVGVDDDVLLRQIGVQNTYSS
jgi:hypothetical protein